MAHFDTSCLETRPILNTDRMLLKIAERSLPAYMCFSLYFEHAVK